MLRILQKLMVLRLRKKSKALNINLDEKCTMCKNITAVRYMRGEIPGAVLSELGDASMILTIQPIKSHIGNPSTKLKLCKKHHRMLFNAMDDIIDKTIKDEKSNKVQPPHDLLDPPLIPV